MNIVWESRLSRWAGNVLKFLAIFILVWALLNLDSILLAFR